MSEKILSLAPTFAKSNTSVPYTPRQHSAQVGDLFSPKAFQYGEEAYAHYYLTLKSQRTILQRLLNEISDDRNPSSALTPPHQPKILFHEKNQVSIKIFRDFLNIFLNCSYGELLIVSAAATDAIQPIIRNQTTSDVIKKIAHRLMNSVLAINHLLASIQNECHHTLANNETNNSTMNIRNDNTEYKYDDDKDDADDNSPKEEICRICNESVPIELFEEHIKYCKQAYDAESKLRINQTEMSYTQNIICEDYLCVSWPGEREEAEKTILPMLRVSLLLERAYQIDFKTQDDGDEFQHICEILTGLCVKFINLDIESPYAKIISHAKEQISQKAQLLSILNQAAEVLKKTRISGNDDTQKIAQIKISDFIFIKRISAGAFARVFLARKKVSNDIYAIKVLSKDDVVQKNQVKRVVLEKDILLRSNNPYIINFYYSISGTRNLYLVMEYLPGGDLYSLLQEFGCLSESTAKVYTYQIAVALSSLHSKGIIHRDIKPDNVLVAANGHLKLTDFGLSYVGITDRNQKASLNKSKESRIRHSLSTGNHLSKKTGLTYRNTILLEEFDIFNNNNNNNGDEVDNSNKNSNKVTLNENKIRFKTSDDDKLVQTRSIVGTPDYTAPEIIEGKEHTFAVDWWSLGAVLYEFLIGRPPFHAETKEKVYENIKSCNYVFPRPIRGSQNDSKSNSNDQKVENNNHKFDANDKIGKISEGEEEEEEELISEDAADLISKLLTLDPSKRLGFNSSDEVLKHKWFSDIDPSNLEIPFIPILESDDDTQYFKKRYSFTNKNDSDIMDDINDSNRASSAFGFSPSRFRKRALTQNSIHESSLLVPNEVGTSTGSQVKRMDKVESDDSISNANLHCIINSCSYDNFTNLFQSDDPSITEQSFHNKSNNNFHNENSSNSNNAIINTIRFNNAGDKDMSSENSNDIKNSNEDLVINSETIGFANNSPTTVFSSDTIVLSTSGSGSNSSNSISKNNINEIKHNTEISNQHPIRATISDPFANNEYDGLDRMNELTKRLKAPRGQYMQSKSQVSLSPFKSSPTESSFIRFRQNLLSDNDIDGDQQNLLQQGSGSDKSSVSNSSTPSILSAGSSDTNLRLNNQSINDYTDNDSELSSFPSVSTDSIWSKDFPSSNVNALQIINQELLRNRRSSAKFSKSKAKDSNGRNFSSNSFATMETQNKEINDPKKRLSGSRFHMLSADDMCLPKNTNRNDKIKSSYSKSNENSVDCNLQSINTDSIENQAQDENQN